MLGSPAVAPTCDARIASDLRMPSSLRGMRDVRAMRIMRVVRVVRSARVARAACGSARIALGLRMTPSLHNVSLLRFAAR